MRYSFPICILCFSIFFISGLAGCSDDSAQGDAGVADRGADRARDLVSPDRPRIDGAKVPDAPRLDHAVLPDKAPAKDQTGGPDKKVSDAQKDLGATLPDGLTSCTAITSAITSEKAHIAICATTADCTFLYGSCPFGCHIPHNKTADLSKLKALMALYNSLSQCTPCTYKCAAPGTLSCTAGVCQMTYP